MFICNACQNDGSWEYCSGIMKSYGQCEICNEVKVCVDVRAYKRKTCPPLQTTNEKHTPRTAQQSEAVIAKALGNNLTVVKEGSDRG